MAAGKITNERPHRHPCGLVGHGTDQKTHDRIENDQVRFDGFNFTL